MMSEEKDLYKKGENPTLDEGYIVYRKLKIFAGDGVEEALSDKEGTLLVKLWCKEKSTPWKMFKQEVSTLVKFSERVIAWRANRSREKSRIRNERLRKKLRKGAENNDAGAVAKLEKTKKAAIVNSANYRKRKREEM